MIFITPENSPETYERKRELEKFLKEHVSSALIREDILRYSRECREMWIIYHISFLSIPTNMGQMGSHLENNLRRNKAEVVGKFRTYVQSMLEDSSSIKAINFCFSQILESTAEDLNKAYSKFVQEESEKSIKLENKPDRSSFVRSSIVITIDAPGTVAAEEAVHKLSNYLRNEQKRNGTSFSIIANHVDTSKWEED